VTIYLIRSPGDSGEPWVPYDDPRNQGIDWQYLADVLDAKAPPDPERLDAIDIHAPGEAPFESLWVGSDILVSDLLRRALKPACEGDVEFLPLRVNGSRFYALLVVNTLDVLDRERSELKYYRSTDQVITIRRYAFTDVGETRVFKIPEDPGSTFATKPVRHAYRESRVPGLRFVDCENPPPDEGLG